MLNDKKVKFESIEQRTIPTMPEVFTRKAIELGLGLPPLKETFVSSQDYGAKCMLLGYEFAKKKYKKKYKKQIKKLKAELKAANNKPLGILKEIEQGDVSGLSFAFEQVQQEER